MTPYLIVGAILVVLLIAGVVVARRRGSGDTVAAFRRQIDALGPEARRPTVDRVQEFDDERRGSHPHAQPDVEPDPASEQRPDDKPEPGSRGDADGA